MSARVAALVCALSVALWPARAALAAEGNGAPGLLPPAAGGSATGTAPQPEAEHPLGLHARNLLVIGAGAGAVAAYGSKKWWSDGFSGGFKIESEHWFGADTYLGGTDKVGHAYANNLGVRLLTPVFQAVGNSREAAVSLAAWSTFLTYAGVEIVDAFSRKYRFSAEDLASNAAGALFGYALETRPELDALLDLRLDYRRSPYSSGWDPFGDYSGQRFLLVLKADGFAALRANPWTRYVEVALGYRASGFDAPAGMPAERRREVYAGLSLNLARVIADGFYEGRSASTRVQRAAERTLELVQLPTIAYRSRSLD